MAPQLVGHGSVPAGIISIGVGALVNGLLNGITSWVESGTAALLAAFGHALNATTNSPLANGFGTEFSVVWKIGVVLTLPFLLLATIHAVVRQDLSLITRAVFVRLPFAVLFGGLAVELVTQALAVTDALSAALLAAAGQPARLEINQLVGAFSPVFGGSVLSGFTGVLLAILAAAVAFILWVELIIRSAAIAVATLFIPLALAGLVWSATAHWARRVGETLAALIGSKLVIAGVLALAALSLGDASGLSGVVQGIALLALAALSPFALLKLIPLFEAGAVSHLEGPVRRGYHAGLDAATLAVSSGALLGAGSGETVASGGAGVEFAQGAHLGGTEYLAAVEHFREVIDQRDALVETPVVEPERSRAAAKSSKAGSDDD
ncbi:MAG TPA: hypothetical protein VED84_07710 [Acidimicrobiales bacterium]|nr:hypothetical protein [Acidimicrobiales bacterium]